MRSSSGTDAHLYELFGRPARSRTKTTTFTHAPLMSGGAPGAFFDPSDRSQHVVYRDQYAHLRELT
jgi:hypothetical protein